MPTPIGAGASFRSNGADPDQRSSYQWNPRQVRADDSGVLYTRFDVDLAHATPLMAAAVVQDTGLAELLVAHKAKARARDAKGRTALDYARETRNPQMIALLDAQR